MAEEESKWQYQMRYGANRSQGLATIHKDILSLTSNYGWSNSNT